MSDSGTTAAAGHDWRASFAAGGRVGKRLAAHDWAPSPLGPVESWPGSLRTAVLMCLHSPFPLAVWWGPDLVLLYNDAYQPILGPARGHPVALPGAVVWSDVWHHVGPLLDDVLAGKGSLRSDNQLVPIDRHGYRQECYFTFSFSPIIDESGSPGGVLTAVTETTAQVVGTRRWKLLTELAGRLVDAGADGQIHDRAARVLAAHPDDVVFVRLYRVRDDGGFEPAASAGPGPDDGWPLAEVAAGRGLRLVGADGDDPDRPAQAAVAPVVEPGSDRVAAVLVLGLSARLPADAEYRMFVERVAGHLGTAIGGVRRAEVERDRAESRALLAAVRAEQRADRRFRCLVEASTAVVWTADRNGDFVTEQASWRTYTGQAWPEHAGDGWLHMLHPDDRGTARQDWRAAVAAGRELYEATGRVWHAASAGYRHFLVRATAIHDHAGGIVEWIGTLTDVHDRVTAESVAQRSAAISDALLTASPVGFGWVDAQLRFQRVNPALCAINHLAEEEHLGRRPSQVIPVHGELMEDLMRRALADGPVTGVDISATPVHRPGARTQHVVASYFPIRIPGTRENVGVGFTIVDVTERTALLDALGAERSRYERLAATDVLAVFSGLDEAITEANDAFLTMLGYTAEDLAAGRLRWSDLTPPGWEYADERALAELRRTGRVAAFDKEYLHRDGRRIPVLIGVVALAREPLRWLAYAADLSAERAAQAELRLFRALVERSGDFVAVADADGHTVYVNPAGRHLVGLTAEAVRRTRITDFAAASLRETWRTEVLPAVVRDGHHRTETRLARFDDGQPVDVDYQVFTVGGEDRDGRGYLASVARDITERQRSLRRAEALAGFAAALGTARGGAQIAEAAARHAIGVFDAVETRVGRTHPQREQLDVVSAEPYSAAVSAEPYSAAVSAEPDSAAIRWRRVSLDGVTGLATAARENRTVVDDRSICVPLRYGDGSVLGALQVTWRTVADDEALTSLLGTVTRLASEALQRAELARAAEAVAALAARLSATRSTEDAVQAILTGAPQALDAVLPALAVRDGGGRLRIWQTDLPDDLAASYQNLSVEDPRPLAEAVRTGQRIVLPDRAAFRARYPDLVDHAGQLGIVTTVALPLLDSRRRPVAALGMGWSRSRPFRDTDLALLDTIADLCEQTLERTRLVAAEHDLVTRLAGRLGAGPARVPAGLDAAVRYRPAMSDLNLGGDWHDVINLAGDRLAVVVGDVVGHHVEAAADMAQIRTIINTLIRLEVPLEDVFARVTGLLGRRFLGTALALHIDPGSDRLTVARAGHPHPVLVSAGEPPRAVLTATAPPLGLVTGPVPLTVLPFRPGDLLVAYTDGLVERRSRPYDDGVRRLHDVVAAVADEPVERIADTLLADLGGSDDDQALVVVRRVP